jgi:hypothetical protein
VRPRICNVTRLSNDFNVYIWGSLVWKTKIWFYIKEGRNKVLIFRGHFNHFKLPNSI